MQTNFEKANVLVGEICKSFKKGESKGLDQSYQTRKDIDKGNAIISYLKWNLMKKAVDLACFSSPAVQDNFRKIILENCKMKKSSNGRSEMVRILAHLTDNPNAPDENGRTPIYLAASNGHAEIVKILVQWTDNPNATLYKWKITPINAAAYKGFIEIVKTLVPLTDDPNSPDNNGRTPISWAAECGHTEIVKILANLTENPNSLDKYGQTPIYWTKKKGHTEIVKILESFM